MNNRPTRVAKTSRQYVTTQTGIELERASVYMPADCWEALHRLCFSQHLSGSQVIQKLILDAALGEPKDKNDHNDSTSSAA